MKNRRMIGLILALMWTAVFLLPAQAEAASTQLTLYEGPRTMVSSPAASFSSSRSP